MNRIPAVLTFVCALCGSSPLGAWTVNPLPLSHSGGVQPSRKATYDIGFSPEHRQALWVKYTLTSNQVCATGKASRTDDFRKDTSVSNSATPAEYRGCGFDRGHLCPAQDRAYDPVAMSETFLMSNMSPQEGSFNRGMWKELEAYVRNYARKYGEVIVVTGPVILDRHFAIKGAISVPQAYYKVLIDTNRCQVLTYLMPNQEFREASIHDFRVPFGYVETVTGLDIIDGEVPDR